MDDDNEVDGQGRRVIDHAAFARAYTRGASLQDSLIAAGYSPKQARKGMAILERSKPLREAAQREGKLLRDLGRISKDDQELLVRGRLVLNTINGSDRGTASAKVLGSEKRIAMFAPDVQQGIIVIQPPAALEAEPNPLTKGRDALPLGR